ncbi:MAG: primary-amine oxidase, partial [Acidobacteriota bacterium]|nr:primary-amine oxidase [Acidobacteriota bacterium]
MPRPGCAVLIFLCLAADAAPAAHPLDPLTRDEIETAVAVLQNTHRFGPTTRLPLLERDEPLKADILAGRTPPRRAFAVVYERETRQTFEALIDLSTPRLVSWTEKKGVQPPLLIEDFTLAEQIVRADPGWRAAIHKRGITDLSRVQIDAWGAGYEGQAANPHRAIRSVSYYRGDEMSAYFHPIEGLVAWVDLDRHRVERLVDTGVMPLAKPPVLQDPEYKADLRRLDITQPEGVSFRVDGYEVQWDHWRFRYSFDPREGLVLYSVGYLDKGKVRPVIYRASLAEMVVPYGDPGPAWYFRNAFDISEYSFTGRSFYPLIPNADVPMNAAFVSATFADPSGRAYTIPRAASIYERDAGVLWRYADLQSGRPIARRARDLVVATFMSAPPYEYGFNWVFHQDGRIEMQVTLTGIMNTKTIAPGGGDPYGQKVAPELEAVHHQHFFSFRLDMDVDGPENSIVEMNTVPAAAGDKAIRTVDTPLTRELEAKRLVDLPANRMWRIFNPNVKNGFGMPVGYMLMPGSNSVPYASPTSMIRRRAGFLDAHLWVTPFAEDEKYPAGDYVFAGRGGDGLPQWTKQNRPLTNRDLVLWYTLGVTHIPRPEEWPIMSVQQGGFQLAPAGFFRTNPALNGADIK